MAASKFPLILIAALAVLPCNLASAAVLHDPWLERLQVGAYRSPELVVLRDGWPEGLFEPLTADPGWLDGAAQLFAHDQLPRGADLVTWRLAIPALGSAERAEGFYQEARRQWQVLAGLAPVDATVAADWQPVPGPWEAALRRLAASRAWQAGQRPLAARLARELARDARSLDLSPADVLVWSLRATALEAVSPALAPPGEDIWRCLHDLGPYDTRSGWAVWVALQRDRGLPSLTADRADRDAAVMLATAGALFLEAAELRAAGFPPEAEAGLGGLLLPVGELAAHFRRHPLPPVDGRFQGYWLRGQRRLEESTNTTERLARMPGLAAGHRLDLWRRVSEGRLLQGNWPAGLAALDSALTLIGGEASAAMQERLRIWTAQALALALARDRQQDARRVADAAAARFLGDHARPWQDDAGVLLARLGRPAPPSEGDLRSRSEALVLRGEAPAIRLGEALDLPDPAAWRHQLWEAWARWGLALLGPDLALSPRQEAYRLGLAATVAAEEPAQRHTTAVAAAAALLETTAAARPLIAWALARDIEHLAGGVALPKTSPLPNLRPPADRSTRERNLLDHAMMGAAIALADDRGVLAMAVRLPAAGAPAAWRWPFWYPIPADPAVRAALAAAPLPADLLLAIARNESLFEPAIRSRAGALGYMQIMPFHYEDPAGGAGPDHWRHPGTSLKAGARILADAVRRHRGDPYRSVAAYNAGSTAVERWDRQLGAADGLYYRAWISYPETRGYTLRVLRDREVYRALIRGAP